MQAINDAYAFSFLCKPFDNRKMQKQITEVLNGIPNNAIEKEFYKVTDRNDRYKKSIHKKYVYGAIQIVVIFCAVFVNLISISLLNLITLL